MNSLYNLGRFEYVEFLGHNMEPVPESEYMKRPATGCHSFNVKVNIASALGEEGYVEGTDHMGTLHRQIETVGKLACENGTSLS